MVKESNLLMDAPAFYRIRVRGDLDESWSSRRGELTIGKSFDTDEQPNTTLTGSFIDQAALLGTLNSLYNLCMPLVSVEFLSGSEINQKKE